MTRDEFLKRKRYLMRYVKAKQHIDQLEEKLFELDKDTGVRSAGFNNVGTGSNVREFKAQYDRFSELEERINNLLTKARMIRKEIYSCIDTLENSNEAKVLELRFVDDLSFYEIATQTSYSTRWVERLYTAGVQHCVIPKKVDR